MIDQQKEKIIQEVAKSYHSLLRKNNFFPDYNQELEFYEDVSNACVREHAPWEKFILATETAYFAMPYHLRKIVKCDYFYQNYSFWWEEFYTKKQYAKFKEEAVDLFYGNLEKTKALELMKGLKEKVKEADKQIKKEDEEIAKELEEEEKRLEEEERNREEHNENLLDEDEMEL